MNIIVAALATWQILEIWQHSSLMAPLRARTEMWVNKIGELLSCPFCLSPWVSLLCVVIIYDVAGYGLVGTCMANVIRAFAVARLANLGNDFLRNTP